MALLPHDGKKRCPQCWEEKPWPKDFIGAKGKPVGMCTMCRERYQSSAYRSATVFERAKVPRKGVPARLALRARLYLRSGNRKLGGIPASVTSRGTCPPSCAFYDAGCFASYGKQAVHWRRVGEEGDTWEKFLADVRSLPAGQLWRHNVAGDLPGKGESVDVPVLLELVEAAAHTRGFTFTHCHRNEPARRAIKEANARGFTINLSADSLAQADELASLGIGPVAVVLPSDVNAPHFRTKKGNTVTVCPAERVPGMTCALCELCAVPTRKAIIGFRAHGQAKALVSEIVRAKR